MTEDLSAEEKKIVEEALKRSRLNDRHAIPSHKVKEFLQIIGDELKRTGVLKKDYVDRALQQVRSGAN